MNVDGNFLLASTTIFTGIVSSWAIVQYRQNKTEARIDKLETKIETQGKEIDSKLDSHNKEDTFKHDELARRISDQEIYRAEVKTILESVLQRLSSIEKKFDRWFEIIEKRS